MAARPAYTAPERAHNFVAFAREPITTPGPDGQPVGFRPQVFVREYPQILVASVKTSQVAGRNGSDPMTTTSFEFDAKSTGVPKLVNNFHASLRADDPAYPILMWAHENKEPVTVILETVRKWKNGSDEPIDQRSPIHLLRGSKTIDGAKAQANTTGDNCKNLVAGVAQPGNPASLIVTSEAVSDPSEWVALRPNRTGEYAPPGWRTVTEEIDGTEWPIGITDAGVSSPAGGSVVVDASTVTLIAQQVAELLRPMVADKGPQPRPVLRTQVAQEEQPWKAWNSDGQLNAGSWAMSKRRAHFEYALMKLTAAGYTPTVTADLVVVETNRLTDALLWIVDAVHDAVVPHNGSGWLTKSHGEASRIVMSVIDKMSKAHPDFAHLEITGDLMVVEGAMKDWAKRVRDLATGLFRDYYQRTEAALDPQHNDANPAAAVSAASGGSAASPTSPASAPKPPTQPAAPQATPAAPAAPAAQAPQPQAESVPVADTAAVMRGFAELILATGDPDLKANPALASAFLIEKFGTDDLAEVDPLVGLEKITLWHTSPARFLDLAIAAHQKVLAAK